jgi:uncharacterized protein (TIGR02466 family)
MTYQNKISVFSLFPKVLGVSNESYKINEDELSFIKNLERRIISTNLVTYNQNILDLPELKNLKSWLQENINVYFFDVLQIKNIDEIYITQSWSNITEKGQNHNLHHHQNSIVSGVMHFDDNDSNLNFYSEDETPYLFDFSYKSRNEFNSSCWSFPTQKNKLFLFPSKLYHNVHTQIKNSDRISLAFNTWIKGFVGEEDNSNLLKIN